jgi:peptidyl-prolyl cis-trans isomerase D
MKACGLVHVKHWIDWIDWIMEFFRNLIRGWLGKVLLAIFMVSFVLVGIESYFAGGGGDQEAVKVGQQSISRQEFD